MNGIIGMAHLLLDTDLDEEQHSYADTVRTSANNLLQILNDILDFSKIEAGKMDIQHELFNLHETIEDSLDIFAQTALSRQVDLNAFIAPSVPGIALGDSGRIRQVLQNLIGNSLKFTESGHIEVRALLDKRDDLNFHLRCEVRDTGCGISAEDQKALFDPFYQASHGLRKTHGGTGLGLTISQRLVNAMGGRLGCESQEGKGSCFWFVIPLDVTETEDFAPIPLTRPNYSIHLISDTASFPKQLGGVFSLEEYSSSNWQDFMKLTPGELDADMVILDLSPTPLTSEAEDYVSKLMSYHADKPWICNIPTGMELSPKWQSAQSEMIKMRKPFKIAEWDRLLKQFDLPEQQSSAS